MALSLPTIRVGMLSILCGVAAAASNLRADVLYGQPATGVPTITSSYWAPDGSDFDEHVWDSFWLANAGDISEVRWRGGYGGPRPGGTNNIVDFEIAIYPSITVGYEPDTDHPLFKYLISENGGGAPGNAGETFVETVGGVNLYDYHFVLPQTFMAAGRTNYWVQITAWQSGAPNWGFARASGGNGGNFALVPTENGDFHYVHRSGDTAFSLIGTLSNCTVPTVVQNPVPDEMCFNTRSVDLTVVVTGTGPFTYQWRRNGHPVFDGPNGGGTGGGATITGATTDHLHIMSPSYWHEPGDYDCVIANACGPSLSSAARLDVPFGAPNIAVQPGAASACAEGSAQFSVTTAGYAPFHFAWQWEVAVDTFAGIADGPTGFGGTFTGAGTGMLVITGVGAGDARRYRCVVSNACGSATSMPAALTVGGSACGPSCDSIDFNNDGLFPDTADIDDFLSVFSGGPCSNDPPTGSGCGDIDFNNDGLFPDTTDIDSLLSVFSGGDCV